MALRLKPAIQKRAKENLKTSTGGNIPQPLTKSSKPEKPLNTRKKLAEIAGVSENTISKVEKILNQGTPEQIEQARKRKTAPTTNWNGFHKTSPCPPRRLQGRTLKL